MNKILVANRGEIALRIVRAARELGISTVAIYSEADADSLHVKFADESVCIGPPSASESYLKIPKVIAAAEITGADAIHPGYGFLSENADFARTCEKSGFRFIGPKPDHIDKMGDKITARRTMRDLGLHSLPGSPGPLESAEEAKRLAHEIGFPLIVKAAAGGGGRGMKIVRDPKALDASVELAQTEARAAFGNGAVYVERFVEKPRHIEFQVAADDNGRVIHLGERECSVQRRYQKLVEESPSPALTDAKRAEIGSRITSALASLGYTNVGTVELLMDEHGELWFMEMNTRIQVEHPVTEMVTGIDLVRTQILLAQGEFLPLKQEELRLRGHAIEVRINAEDPERFAPSPGTITDFHMPGGVGVRIDSHVTSGTTVPPHYDSLIGKLIVHDVDRPHALKRLAGALRETVVNGIQTNIPFHRRVLENPEFIAGDYDTNIVRRILEPEKPS
ncbi:MAG: acetyl-CoA carboxylase biotin carboxylase subunit [Myxococcales bacterium]|nr:acetyl-CoA carboxylase biotin carboxylase subunit [Myxococcales bacterium]